MIVRVVKSFSDILGSYVQGQEIELPDGVDWIKAGLVEVVEEVLEAPAKKLRKTKAE